MGLCIFRERLEDFFRTVEAGKILEPALVAFGVAALQNLLEQNRTEDFREKCE